MTFSKDYEITTRIGSTITYKKVERCSLLKLLSKLLIFTTHRECLSANSGLRSRTKLLSTLKMFGDSKNGRWSRVSCSRNFRSREELENNVENGTILVTQVSQSSWPVDRVDRMDCWGIKRAVSVAWGAGQQMVTDGSEFERKVICLSMEGVIIALKIIFTPNYGKQQGNSTD